MSSWQTPKTNWGQPGQTVPVADDFNRIEENIKIIGQYDRAPGYGIAYGTNSKIITLNPAPTSYYEGMCFAFRNEVQNTGPVTINVNGLGAKSIKKPNGNDLVPGNLKAGSVYTVRYNGTNFILQGSDAAGTATPGDVTAGKTFSNDDDTDLVGTLPILGNRSATLTINGPGTPQVVIPPGRIDQSTIVARIDPSKANIIKLGETLGGVTGTLKKAAGNATPDDVRAGKTFSNDDGPDQVGTLPDRGGANIQARLSSDVTIPRGIYNGNGKVLRPKFQVGAFEHVIEPYSYHYIFTRYYYWSSNYRFNYAGQVRLKLYVSVDQDYHRSLWLKLYHNTTLVRFIPAPLPGELTEYIDDITVAVNDTVYYEVYNTSSLNASGIRSGLSMLLDAEPLFTDLGKPDSAFQGQS